MPNKKYTTDFKKTIVNLYNSGKSYAQIRSEYGVSANALSNWIKLYSDAEPDGDAVDNTQQIKDLQKQNEQLKAEIRQLKEETQILRKAITIIASPSNKD